MALVTATTGWDSGGLACYSGNAHFDVVAYLDNVEWGRDTTNAARSKLTLTLNSSMAVNSLVWASAGNFSGNYVRAWNNIETKTSSNGSVPKQGTYCSGATGCCYCLCSGVIWYWSHYFGYYKPAILCNSGTTQILFNAAFLDTWTGTGTYNLPNNLRVLPPVGLTVSWGTNITDSTTVTISKWSNNTNIKGSPTTYTGAKIWNFAFSLLDESGNVLAHKLFNTGETLSCSSGPMSSGWYTGDGLVGSSVALSTPYTLEAGKKYKIRAIVSNNMNQTLDSVSGTYISDIPAPTVDITSCIYNPTTKKAELTFNWSKAVSGGAETITYYVYDANGTYYVNGDTLATTTDGEAKSGTQTVNGLPTGETIYVKVVNSGSGKVKKTVESTISPVANAAFLGFDWDELRRVCTVRAEAPGAANCRIQAGYSAGVYDVGDKLTTGQIGTLIVSDLQHGDGQILYLQAVPETSDGHKFLNEVAKISVPIPNPILGIKVPSCELGEAGMEKEYIVDVVEKKQGATTCTTRWQVGDRIVAKGPCGS